MGKKTRAEEVRSLRTRTDRRHGPRSRGAVLSRLLQDAALETAASRPNIGRSSTGVLQPSARRDAISHNPRAGDLKQTQVRDVYQVAKEIPGILAQQPCYCYFQPKGHRGLLDCFKTDHAASCEICLKEALLASEMHRQGKSAEEIRNAIFQGQWAEVRGSNQ